MAMPLVPDTPDSQLAAPPGILEGISKSLYEKLMMDDKVDLAGDSKDEEVPQTPQQKQHAEELIEETHEMVNAEAQKAPDMPDMQPLSKEPEFQMIPEDSPLIDFEPVIKAPELPDVPEDAPLELDADQADGLTSVSMTGTPHTLSRYASRDSLYDDVNLESVSASVSRRGSLTLHDAVTQALAGHEDAPLRPRRLSEGSTMSDVRGLLSRQLSECSSVFNKDQEFETSSDASPEGPEGAGAAAMAKTRKMSVISMATTARSRRASESSARSDQRQPRVRRFSVNVASIGNPKVGVRMRRYSEVNEVCQESLAMLKASKVPVLKFTNKAAKGVSKCCRHPSREEMRALGEPPVELVGLPEGAVSVCKCCGSRRFSAAAFGVDGPPIHLSSSKPPTCLVCSPVVCQGDLLRVVQLAGVFPDSKTFVDKKVKQSPEETIRRFQELLQRTAGAPTREQVIAFVDQSFEVSEHCVARCLELGGQPSGQPPGGSKASLRGWGVYLAFRSRCAK